MNIKIQFLECNSKSIRTSFFNPSKVKYDFLIQNKVTMTIYRLGDKIPKIHPTAWIADNATIIGDVTIGAHTSVWFNTVIRGDNEHITIGKNSNIQDGSVLHADPGFPLIIGDDVTIGHMVMLHGCTIKNHCLIGIKATILNGSLIETNSLVGAGSLIAENKHFPPNVLLIGMPARIAKTMDDIHSSNLSKIAAHYVTNQQYFKKHLSEYACFPINND